ncbi:MAG: VOC family protein, partial [Actinomycetota bacterium]
DLDRAIAFYRDALGLTLRERWGGNTAFLAAGDDDLHHVILERAPGPGIGPGGIGIRLPDRAALAAAVRRLRDHGIPIDDAVDHGWCEAVRVRDPDGHGIALVAERPPARRPRRADGSLHHHHGDLDLDALLREG